MTLATGAQAELGYIEEVSYGVTPATPALVALPVTSWSPVVNKGGFQSNDIRSDRQIADYRHGDKSTSIGVEFELKHTEFDPFLEAALFGSFAADVLKAGSTRKFFSMETAFRDIGRFHCYKGMIVQDISFSISADSPAVTGSMTLLGQDMVNAGASVDADAYTAAGAFRSMDSFNGTLNEGGSAIGIVTGLEISLTNNLTPAKAIGDITPRDYFDGRCNVTGTVSAFVEDDSLLQKFLDEVPSSIDLTLADPDANTLQLELPRIIYTGGEAPVSGEAGMIITLPFQGTYDAGEGTAFKITRS